MLNISDLTRPDLPNQNNYEQALALGLQVFSRKDPGKLAINAGALFSNRALILPHLDREIVLDLNSQRFSVQPSGEEAPVWLAILAVHYINNAPGAQPTGKLKHFREFKEGGFYEPAFNRRTKDILIKVVGNDPSPMRAAAGRLNGKIVDSGDVAVELPYFPFLPITCILWQGDDEFSPEASVLFDETADLFFSAEDMAVAGQMAVLELLKAAK